MKRIKRNERISIRTDKTIVNAIQDIKEAYEKLNEKAPNTPPYHPTTTEIIEEGIMNMWDFYVGQYIK